MSFWNENISALFGIAGVFLGSAMTYAVSWRLRKRDYDLCAWDRLLERRIAAHESVLAIALDMRVMYIIGGLDSDRELRRAPSVLASRDSFNNWINHITSVVNVASPWLSIEATREVNFLQDYLLTLHENTYNLQSEIFPELGGVIRQDFIDLSSSLEGAIRSFFDNDIRKLSLRDTKAWHKYPREETENRLKSTCLISEWNSVAYLCKQKPHPNIS